jgi:IclR family transcriptional regulator, KDG regulon repressor
MATVQRAEDVRRTAGNSRPEAPATPPENGAHRGQVTDRVLLALETLADAPGGLGVSDLGRRLGVDKSTAHRLLGTMAARGFVRLNPHSQRYTLGLRLVALGTVAARSVDLTDVARPYLEALRDQTAEATSLAVLSEGEVLFLARAAAPGVLSVDHGVGTRMPVHCSALGKVLLATADDEALLDQAIARRGMARFTPRTITDRDDLIRHLGQVAARGWALDDEEFTSGLRCLAAPLRDASGAVVAALGVAGPAARVTLERVDPLAALLCATATQLSHALGDRRPSAG